MKTIIKTRVGTPSSEELSLMWTLVMMEYPNTSLDEQTALITKEFGIEVDSDALVSLGALDREIEDRMLIYKHCVE